MVCTQEMQEGRNHLQVHKSVWPPGSVEESGHVVILFVGNLRLDLVLDSLYFVWIFIHVLGMKVPELLELVIAVLIDIDRILSLFNCHDISAIFDT